MRRLIHVVYHHRALDMNAYVELHVIVMSIAMWYGREVRVDGATLSLAVEMCGEGGH
jgi:hypothetical protein